MNSVDKATQTQLLNIQSKTGKTMDQLFEIIRISGLVKHTEILQMLKKELSLGHGDANALGLAYKKAVEISESESGDVLNEIYSGPKAVLRTIHEKLIAELEKFGDFEIAPKKGYVSLRRKKQFAMIGPAAKQRIEIGINLKGLIPGDRLLELPAGGMCQFKVFINSIDEIDSELLGWLHHAYDDAS